MSTRAKFQVGRVEDADGYYGKGKTISLHAVVAAGPYDENTSFFNSTPTGSITLYCVNPKANEQFVEGKEV